MTKFFFLLICSIVWSSNIYSSNQTFAKIEQLIFDEKLDSAILLLDKNRAILEETDSSYSAFLFNKIKDFKDWDYKSHGRLINVSYFRVDPNVISKFYTKHYPLDLSQNEYDEGVFYIYYLMIGMYREYGDLDKANEYYEALSIYSESTKESTTEESYIKQSIRLSTHEAVLAGIENNVDKGLKITQNMLEQATKLNDTSLMVLAYYYRMEFLIPTGKIDEYIALGEKSLALEEKSQNKSEFGYSITSNLIDAYIYKGVEKEKIWVLLEKLYREKGAYRSLSYPFFIKALKVYEDNSAYRKKIFDLWQVNDVVELAEATWKRTQSELLKPEQKMVLSSITAGLANLGEYKSAYEYSLLLTQLSNELYSDELKNSITSLNATVEIQERELRIHELEKEKSEVEYWFLLALLALVLVASIVTFILLNNRRKNKISAIAQDKLTELSQYKAAFYSNMAVELKESIEGIESGLNEVISEESDLKQKSKGAVNFALHNTNKVKDRISQILVTSEIDEGTIKPDKKNFYLHPLLKSLPNSYSQEAGIKGLNIVSDIQVETNDVFKGDRTLVKLVLQNLLYNAIRNCPENNQISIKANMTGGLLNVEINESSPVPSHKQQEELLGKVHKNKENNKLGGFGLRLSLAKRIIDIIGGNIGVYPGPENSTTYTLQLPSS